MGAALLFMAFIDSHPVCRRGCSLYLSLLAEIVPTRAILQQT